MMINFENRNMKIAYSYLCWEYGFLVQRIQRNSPQLPIKIKLKKCSPVWELYRVPKYGLFAEYYPSEHRPDLTYFNDSTRQAQEVSYLWPLSGIFLQRL